MEGTSTPADIGVSGRRVGLVGFDDQQAATLPAALEAAGVACAVVTVDLAAKRSPLEAFDAILLMVGGEVVPETTVRAILETCVRLVVAVGSEPSIKGQLAVLKRPTRAYAVQPCSADEILMRIATLPWSTAVLSSGPTVIIADDDPVAAAVLEATLSKDGLGCHVAANGDEALALAKQLRPVAMLLDVNMPGADGFHVLQAIKADPATAATRVLMLTGRADKNDVLRGCALGADDYIAKPFKAADVALRVKSLLGGAC